MIKEIGTIGSSRLTDIYGICQVLHVSPSTIYRWLRIGMPKIQIIKGGKLLFDIDQVAQWVSTASSHVQEKIHKIRRLKNA